MDHLDDVPDHLTLPGGILPETFAAAADQSPTCAPRQIGCALCVKQFLESATCHAVKEEDGVQRGALEMVGQGETLFRAVLEAAANLERDAGDPVDGFPFESVAAAVVEVFGTLRALLVGSRLVA